MKTDNPALVGVHKFEASGLGKAPFRCVGYGRLTYQACPGAPVQPGGTCDYCGTAIIDAFRIRGIDGREFKVGSDCVLKTGDAGLIRAYKKSPEYRKAQRDKRDAKDLAVRQEWDRLMADPAILAKLSKMTVPGPSWRPEPRPLLDYLNFCWRGCGMSGRGRWLKNLKNYIAKA